jgi:cell division transport system permease protein
MKPELKANENPGGPENKIEDIGIKAEVKTEPKTEAEPKKEVKTKDRPKNTATPKKKAKSGSFKLRNFKYYLEEALRSFARNKLMTLTSIATVAACLFIVIASYTIATNVNFTLSYIETSVGVTIFVEDDLTEAQVDILYESITAMEYVASVTFIAPDESLKNLAETLGDVDGILMTLLYDNPLRRSFSIYLTDIRFQREIVETLRNLYGVANMREASAVTDILITANNFVGIFSLVIILILGVLAIIIITNTIKLTVNNRRNEIIIMRYIGATEWFIKWPFVIEGVVIGIVGAMIPIAITWFGYSHLISSVSYFGYEDSLTWPFPFLTATDIFPILAPVTIILGAVMGLLGSISSMRKYLGA